MQHSMCGFTDVQEEHTASVIREMEAGDSTKMLVPLHLTTQSNITENSNFHFVLTFLLDVSDARLEIRLILENAHVFHV